MSWFSAFDSYKLQAMIDTFVNISIRLAFKTFNDCLLLIKLSFINQALKFELSECLLDLPER